MNREPCVSVILPSYNRLGHLRVAVESVLAQTLADFELILADDGSAPDVLEWLRSQDDVRIRLLELAHTGNPAAVRNAALRAARGEYVAFLDSDDVWLPDKLARQLDAMRARPERRWSYHACGRIDDAGNPASWAGVRPFAALEGDIVEALLDMRALIATPTVMAHRGLVLELCGFDEAQRFAEDYDLWLRLALRSPVSALAETLTLVRVHTDNYSQDRIGAWLGWTRLYEKMQALMPTPRLRRLCRRRLSICWLNVAVARHLRGERAGAWANVRLAARHGWPFASWWGHGLGIASKALRPRRRSRLHRTPSSKP